MARHNKKADTRLKARIAEWENRQGKAEEDNRGLHMNKPGSQNRRK